MTKKILAMLLTVVMVVSMIPATIFAAGSDVCPVATHSKVECDVEGVKYTKDSVIAPECGQDGYTLYKCECGVYFADDIIEMPEHDHDRNAKPVSARVEATCSEYGKAAFYTCKNCGKDYPEYASEAEEAAALADKNAPYGAIVKEKHVAVDGTDCTAETSVCAKCGQTWKDTDKTPAEKHNFNYNNPLAIVKLPTNCAPGEATFKCEDCDQIDTVLVDFAGHKRENLEYEEEKTPTSCTATGVKEYWYCTECDAKFIENKFGTLVPATDADLVIEADHHGTYVMDYKAPACDSNGYVIFKCEDCGRVWTENVDGGWGHTTLEEVKAHDADPKKVAKDGKWGYEVKDAGCPGGVTYTWTCHEKACSYFDEEKGEFVYENVCGEEQTWTDPATKGHTKKTVTVPATNYVPYSYTIVFCTDPTCTEGYEPMWSVEDYEHKIDGETFYEAELNAAVVIRNGHVYEMTDAEKAAVKVLEIKNIKYSTKAATANKNCSGYAHYYEWDEETNKAPTCTAAGEEFYVCVNEKCHDDKTVATAKLGHTPDYANSLGKSDGYNCTKACKLYCSVCGKAYETYSSAPGHKINEDSEIIFTVEVPNCKQNAGDYYDCVNCGADFTPKATAKYSYVSRYDSYEAAAAAHGEVKADGTFKVKITPTGEAYEGDCEVLGRVEYECSYCNRSLWVVDTENTGHCIPDPDNMPVYHEEANCLHGKGYETFDCFRCGETVEAEPALPHDLTKYDEIKGSCTVDGNIEYYTCANECCQYENADGEMVPYLYKKVKTTQVVGGIKKTVYIYVQVSEDEVFDIAINHVYDITIVVPENCTTYGFTYHECVNCGDNYIDELVEPRGHKKLGTTAAKLDPTCETDGYEFFWCAYDDCTGEDGIADDGILNADETLNAEGDDGLYVDAENGVGLTVKPALGHINASGETFTSKCTDKATDRVCVRVDCPVTDGSELDGNDKPNKVSIKKAHDKTDELKVEATCETPAYTLITCKNGCGEVNEMIVDKTQPALGHMLAWGDHVGAEFADADLFEYWGDLYLKGAKQFNEMFFENAIIAYTPATYTAKGSVTFTCATCGHVMTMDVKEASVDFTFEFDNAVIPGASFVEIDGVEYFAPVDGDVIAVDVKMSAFDASIFGFNFDLKYSAYSLNFLGYKFNVADKFANFKLSHKVDDVVFYDDVNMDGINEAIYTIKAAEGTIGVSAYTENDMNGKTHEADFTGSEAVLTLYFQIEGYAEYIEMGVDKVIVADSFGIDMIEAAAADAKDDLDVETDESDVFFNQMMDTNANGNFNITDLANCNKILTGEAEYEYLAAADANKDGKITITDLQLMNELLIGALTEKEICEKLAWTAPEGFVAA